MLDPKMEMSTKLILRRLDFIIMGNTHLTITFYRI